MQLKTFDLTLLSGTNGFTVLNMPENQGELSSVSSAGDMNGDGIADLMLGAGNYNLTTNGAGQQASPGVSYVIFGSREEFWATFNLATLNGTNGFTVPGVTSFGYLGTSVSTAGDINADGISDLVLGAPGYPPYMSSTVYVIFGSRGGFESTFNLATLNGNNGFIVPGIVSGGRLGYSVSTAGDINGDTITDLVLGANEANSGNGTSYVIFGSRTGFPQSFDLTSLNGSNGFVILGVAAGGLGSSVNKAGDINDDGIADLVLGAPNANSNSGAAYIIFGTRNGFPPSFNLNTLKGANGFTVFIASGIGLGTSVDMAGDVNEDGIADLVLGAPWTNLGYGASYVIFGSRNPFPASFNLANLDGSNGFTIPGIINFGSLGSSVSSASDINGDNIADVLLAAAGDSNSASYVIFGNRNGFPASLNLATLNGSNGFTIQSSEIVSVSNAGDINADGTMDLVLGTDFMISFVIFGGLASITFSKNELTIIEGQTVILSNMNLDAIGFIYLGTSGFIINQIQGGRFTLVNDSATSIFNFTQTQVSNGQIQFISDRSDVVAYQVGIINITNNQIVFGPVPANINFTNYPPVVMNPPTPNTQIAVVGESFNFAYAANSIFNDMDGDPLTYSAELSDGSALPNWLQFNVRSNQLSFSGIAPDKGSTAVSLVAKDPLNASVSTGFDLLAVPGNSTNIVNGVSTSQIAGGVVGGVLGLVAAISAGLGFWRYAANKNTRKGEQFADAVHIALNLKGVDDFESEAGQQFVAFIHSLQGALKEVGMNTSMTRPLELRQLADDVADAAHNKISSSTDCLGRSVITVTDLNDNLQSLVNEVQVLRSGGKQNTMQ